MFYRKLKWEHIPKIIHETLTGTASVVFIIVAANIFGYYMNWEMIPQAISSGLLSITSNKYLMLLIINILLLIMGMFLEGGACIIILAPLLCPVVASLGVDLVHFGLVCIVNIMIGGITPPYGSMMFTCCAITGCKLGDFIKEIIPFIVALIVVLFVITYFPGLVTFLPNLMYK